MSNNSSYKTEFLPYIIKWGRITNLYAIAISFLPVAVVLFVFDFVPSLSAVAIALSATVGVVGVMWFSDPIAFYPILGIPGVYMAHLSGNTANLKVPVSAIAQEAAGVEVGSEQGGIITTIAIAVSSIECLIFLTFAVVLGTSLLSKMPASVTFALQNYLLPSLHISLLVRLTANNVKLRTIASSIVVLFFILYKAGIFGFLPGRPTYIIIFAGVFGTMFLARILMEREEKNKNC